jgi:predicted PurR-regulated permease PerM
MDYPLILGIAAVFLYIIPYLGMAVIALSAGLTAYFTARAPENICAPFWQSERASCSTWSLTMACRREY